MSSTPIVFGVAGGTASGKTTVARQILDRVGARHIAYLPHDAYYRDLSHLPMEQRAQQNVDHPDALESDLLARHIRELRQGRPVPLPVYDFATYTRLPETVTVEPASVILVDGILIFAEPELRGLMDIKVFVDTDADIRLIRRIQRDTRERGRTLSSVVFQYLDTVRPMDLEFVQPSRRYADIIIPGGGQNRVAIEMVVSRLQAILPA
ncbi:MAG: uridine kinase [Opitutae bacterium]|jgi:uridine kinase|nr:uridine kinase [Kiritimatiellia bacterium]NCC91967.1 uridine kinase [Opitutae bacterium]